MKADDGDVSVHIVCVRPALPLSMGALPALHADTGTRPRGHRQSRLVFVSRGCVVSAQAGDSRAGTQLCLQRYDFAFMTLPSDTLPSDTLPLAAWLEGLRLGLLRCSWSRSRNQSLTVSRTDMDMPVSYEASNAAAGTPSNDGDKGHAVYTTCCFNLQLKSTHLSTDIRHVCTHNISYNVSCMLTASGDGAGVGIERVE
eukprot:363322-Chlamydomonas_euryale.AAC.2